MRRGLAAFPRRHFWAAALLAALAVLAVPVVSAPPSRATDPEAPAGAPAHWLPNEEWVWQHWLPYDEGRLYSALGITRRGLWRQLRDDSRTVAQLAERRGLKAGALAASLVAPRRASVSPAKFRQLRSRANRTLTQGHLAQHVFFHSLHQGVIPDRAPLIFGVESTEDLQRLRRAELSPLQIARLHRRSRGQVTAAAERALRERARAGVRGGDISAGQATILLSRQLRQLPRWLGQTRYNGPPPLDRDPKAIEKAKDYAGNASISADGRNVVFEAYEAAIPVANAKGEINVRARADGAEHSTLVSLIDKGAGGPRSAYNPSMSADGRYVAYESSPGNLNFAKRYGGIGIVVRDRASSRIVRVDPANAAESRRERRSSYNPSMSANGRYVAFESAHQVQAGSGRLSHRLGVFVHDLRTGSTKPLLPSSGSGAQTASAAEPTLSGDGRYVAFTSNVSAGSSGAGTGVFVHDFATGRSVIASRGDGARGALADGESYEPSISEDGSRVAFTSTAGNLGGGGTASSRIYVRDLKQSTTTLAGDDGEADASGSRFSFEPALSADGRFVAFATVVSGGSGPIGRRSQVYAHDLQRGTTTLVSRTDGAEGTQSKGFSTDPAISRDGRHVVFTSDAPNLSDRKIDSARGIFLRDTVDGTTTLVSKGFGVKQSPRKLIAGIVLAALLALTAALVARRTFARRRRLVEAGAG